MFGSPPHPEARQAPRRRLYRAARAFAPLVILLVSLLSGGSSGAASAPSDWPSLNADAAQTNYNANEKGITASNVLKLKVKWTIGLPDLGYPVVAGGRVYVPTLVRSAVHARAIDAATGKQVATFTVGAIGGLLVADGNLYLAGHSLVQVDVATGTRGTSIKGDSTSSQATFTFPLADGKLVASGYASESRTVPNSLYGISPTTGQVVWKIPCINAQGVIAKGRVIAQSTTGTVFYNEVTGQAVASHKSMFSDWFAGDSLIYTVATVGKKKAALYAYGTSGKLAWSRTIGPRINAQGWAHAVDGNAVYVATMLPRGGVEALDSVTGDVLWKRSLPDVQRLAVANNLLYVLTAGIGQPLRLVILHADTGKPVGQLSLTGGYYAFATTNELMIADGMLFIRAVGPTGTTQLVALGR